MKFVGQAMEKKMEQILCRQIGWSDVVHIRIFNNSANFTLAFSSLPLFLPISVSVYFLFIDLRQMLKAILFVSKSSVSKHKSKE